MVDKHILDYGNAFFELVGAGLVWLNVKYLIRDKKIAGISWGVQGFFTTWGLWNVFYYPQLGQIYSAMAGVVLFLGNATWVGLALYYIKKEKKQ